MEVIKEGKHKWIGRIVVDKHSQALEAKNPDSKTVFVWSDYHNDYVEVSKSLVKWSE